MFRHLIVLFVLASVARASVFVNVFEDVRADEDDATRATSSVGGCVEADCNRFCKSAGFRVGTCVNNRCRCTSCADFTGKSLVHLMHDKATTKASSVTSCNFQACEQLCRRLGFPGGACVGDKCKCDNFEPITIDGNSLTQLPHRATKDHVLDSCNFQACDQLCRRLGFPGGACVGDRCDCDNFKEDPEPPADMADEETRDAVDIKNLISIKDILVDVAARVKECDPVTCDDMCRRFNYAGGSCIGGTSGSCLCFQTYEI